MLDYTYSSELNSIGTNPQAKQNVDIRDHKTRFYAVARNKVPYVFIPIKDWLDNIYSTTC
jgi:hypothetical protein